jgi:transketolase C-terminal domain/subunit
MSRAVVALTTARDYPPSGHPRRTGDGYPAEVVYDEFAYKRVVDTYRSALSHALLIVEKAAATSPSSLADANLKIGQTGVTQEGVEYVVVPKGYQRTFDAIAAATKIEGGIISVSVDNFHRAMTSPSALSANGGE